MFGYSDAMDDVITVVNDLGGNIINEGTSVFDTKDEAFLRGRNFAVRKIKFYVNSFKEEKTYDKQTRK